MEHGTGGAGAGVLTSTNGTFQNPQKVASKNITICLRYYLF